MDSSLLMRYLKVTIFFYPEWMTTEENEVNRGRIFWLEPRKKKIIKAEGKQCLRIKSVSQCNGISCSQGWKGKDQNRVNRGR